MHRKISLITLRLSGLLLMTGCSSSDPAPTASTAAFYKSTKMAVTPIEQRLEIDGCTVSVHRVTTTTFSDFTVAVAKCPTATVTSIAHSCGKNCNSNNIVVQPAVPDTAPPRADDAKAQGTTQQDDARNQELRAEVDRLTAKLTRIQEASQP